MNFLVFLKLIIVQLKSYKFTIIVFLMVIPTFSYSRNRPSLYDWSAGLRIGFPTAFSLKHYHNQKISFEGIAAYNNPSAKANSIQLSLACQYNFPIKSTKNLNWFIGAGLSGYRWNWKNGYNGESHSTNVIGTFAQIGLDYRFKKAPINISLDWMPTYQFSGYESGLGITGGAVGLRYIF
jgi:hypothetical protein